MKKKRSTRPRADDRWDHVRRGLEELPARIATLVNKAGKAYREARGYVWDFVTHANKASEKFHNELVDHVKAQAVSIDEWFDRLYAPIDAVFEDRRDVVHAIREGMTRKQFVEQSLPKWLAKNAPRTKEVDDEAAAKCPIPPEPAKNGKHLTPEEVAAMWRHRSMAWQAKFEQLKAAFDDYRRETQSSLNELVKVIRPKRVRKAVDVND